MKVVDIHNTPSLRPSFERFLAQQNNLFYNNEWLQIYENKNLRQCALVNKNNEVIGAFQYLQFKKVIFNCCITPPFMPSIALQFSNPAESIVGRHTFSKEVMEAMAAYFSDTKAELVDIALPVEVLDTQPFTWKGFKSHLRYTYHLPLQLSQEDLWQRLSSEKRKSISKAEKDGLLIKPCTDFEAVAGMVISSLERNKALANEDLIKAIISPQRAKYLRIFGAYESERLMAVSVAAVQDKSYVYLFGGTTHENRHHGAGVSCMWHSILSAKAEGKTIFDFEGSMQPGIERYFREFGGELVPYAAITKKSFLLDLLMRFK